MPNWPKSTLIEIRIDYQALKIPESISRLLDSKDNILPTVTIFKLANAWHDAIYDAVDSAFVSWFGIGISGMFTG